MTQPAVSKHWRRVVSWAHVARASRIYCIYCAIVSYIDWRVFPVSMWISLDKIFLQILSRLYASQNYVGLQRVQRSIPSVRLTVRERWYSSKYFEPKLKAVILKQIDIFDGFYYCTRFRSRALISVRNYKKLASNLFVCHAPVWLLHGIASSQKRSPYHRNSFIACSPSF